jgi:2-polyprenyl-6-hydroxyphenyl methylase/3-demethylubiquinone-9 3-methyltransferase
VDNHDRQTIRPAALLDIDAVAVAHINHPLVEGIDRRIKKLRRRLLACELLHERTIYPGVSCRHINHAEKEIAMAESDAETAGTVDPGEIAKFEAMASEWWNPTGKFKPLHMLQPCRLDYITEQVAAEFDRDLSAQAPFAGLRMLDVGCGGGLLCEPMARLGAEVVGADAAERNIGVAQVHAELSGLAIDYRHTTAESLATAGEAFDVVLAMEVIEHVSDPAAFIAACRSLLRPGGLLIASTLNRNPKSFVMGIVGAEYVMRWLPRGTHDWRKFITPDEFFEKLRAADMEAVDRKGFVFSPVSWAFSVSDRDLSMNYVVAARRPG